MPGVLARDGQPIELLLKLLKKQVEKSGVIKDVRKKEFYEKPSVRKKKKAASARKRLAKLKRKENNR